MNWWKLSIIFDQLDSISIAEQCPWDTCAIPNLSISLWHTSLSIIFNQSFYSKIQVPYAFKTHLVTNLELFWIKTFKPHHVWGSLLYNIQRIVMTWKHVGTASNGLLFFNLIVLRAWLEPYRQKMIYLWGITIWYNMVQYGVTILLIPNFCREDAIPIVKDKSCLTKPIGQSISDHHVKFCGNY